MQKIIFDYSKLKGRITEKCGTKKAFAKLLGIAEGTLIGKLKGLSYFSQSEILRSIRILDIEPGDVSAYFFTV